MKIDLDRLESLRRKASQGPWVVAKIGPSVWSGSLKVNTRGEARGADKYACELFELAPDGGRYSEVARTQDGAYELALRDAELIAAMHTLLPDLIGEIRELRAKVERFEGKDT